MAAKDPGSSVGLAPGIEASAAKGASVLVSDFASEAATSCAVKGRAVREADAWANRDGVRGGAVRDWLMARGVTNPSDQTPFSSEEIGNAAEILP